MKAKVRISTLIISLSTANSVLSCPVCKRQQSKFISAISHGAGPDSRWDYLIIVIALAIVLFTLFFSARYLLKPGEKSLEHIKRTVLFYQ